MLSASLLWLFAQGPRAQAACVELNNELPAALRGCVAAAQLCVSYRRALADHATAGARIPGLGWHVDLRGQADPQTSAFSLEMDAFAAGQLQGRRTLSVHAQDCAALPDTLGLVLVLLGEEVQRAATTGDAASLSPAPSASALSHADRRGDGHEATNQTRARQAPAAQLELGAALGFYIGVLPSTAPALQLHAATLHGPIPLRLGAAWLWPQTWAIAEGHVQMRDYELSIDVCPVLHWARGLGFALRLCAGPRLGVVDARSRGFTIRNEHTALFYLYVGLLPEISVALSTTSWLHLDAGAAVALVRPRFTVGLDGGTRRTTLDTFTPLRAEIMLHLAHFF